MKACSTCGWRAYSSEHGTWGDCTILRMRRGSPCAGTRETERTVWLPRCRECGDPASYQWSLGGISAYYCDECVKGLGIVGPSTKEI